MRKIILCFFILTTILFSGCFNYRDIDKIIFVTAVIIDVDENGEPIFYIEAFKPRRGSTGASGKGEKVLFQGASKTIFQTVRDINLSSTRKLNYTQNRGLIFTEKAAEKGLDNFIDFFDRDEETVVRANIAIYKGNPQSLLNAKLKEQEYIGLFIQDLIYNIKFSSRSVILSINEFLNINLSPSPNNIAIIPTLTLKSDQLEDKVEISSAAIIKDFKLIGFLDRRQGEGYNFLIDNIKGGTLEVGNPNAPGKFITLEILKSKTNTEIYYDGEKLNVKKTITTKTSIADVQQKLLFKKKTISEIEKNAESNINRECMIIFEDYKKKDLDIFKIGEIFSRKYPKEKIENIMNISQLKLDVKVTVEGSSDTTDFRYGSQ